MQILFHLNVLSREGWLDHLADVVSIEDLLSIQTSIMIILVYTPINSGLGYFFPTASSTIIVFEFCMQAILTCISGTSLWFSFSFSWLLENLSVFTYIYQLLKFCLVKNICSCPLPTSQLGLDSFAVVEFLESSVRHSCSQRLLRHQKHRQLKQK